MQSPAAVLRTPTYAPKHAPPPSLASAPGRPLSQWSFGLTLRLPLSLLERLVLALLPVLLPFLVLLLLQSLLLNLDLRIAHQHRPHEAAHVVPKIPDVLAVPLRS